MKAFLWEDSLSNHHNFQGDQPARFNAQEIQCSTYEPMVPTWRTYGSSRRMTLGEPTIPKKNGVPYFPLFNAGIQKVMGYDSYDIIPT